MNELALFAGAGGGILGGKLLGWRTVCAVEWEPYPASVLIARQNEDILPPFPIWDDVRTFDGRPWRGRVDVVSGGFPCQDISAAGKGAGINGERSGMWAHMARIVREVGPRFVFVENSPMLTSRGLGRVLGDLAALGYNVRWGVLGANDAGAPHKRDRIWIAADASGRRCGGSCAGKSEQQGRAEAIGASQALAHADCAQRERDQCTQRITSQPPDTCRPSWWLTEPDVDRVVDGVAARVDRLKAIGNGQVPAVAALAWRILSQ
jgi:DNA (cytosine-5)-methyltransferase 1